MARDNMAPDISGPFHARQGSISTDGPVSFSELPYRSAADRSDRFTLARDARYCHGDRTCSYARSTT